MCGRESMWTQIPFTNTLPPSWQNFLTMPNFALLNMPGALLRKVPPPPVYHVYLWPLQSGLQALLRKIPRLLQSQLIFAPRDNTNTVHEHLLRNTVHKHLRPELQFEMWKAYPGFFVTAQTNINRARSSVSTRLRIAFEASDTGPFSTFHALLSILGGMEWKRWCTNQSHLNQPLLETFLYHQGCIATHIVDLDDQVPWVHLSEGEATTILVHRCNSTWGCMASTDKTVSRSLQHRPNMNPSAFRTEMSKT